MIAQEKGRALEIARLLEVEGLVTQYAVSRGFREHIRRGDATRRAVDGISLHVDVGEMLALVGESGCGKTTTALSILKMVEPRAGSIRLRGTELSHLSDRALRAARREMQLVYQDPYSSLDPRFRVRQTVEEPLLVHAIANRAARARLISQALERVELTPPSFFLERFPHELSGGQRQRVAIAASLVLNPKLLIADEPVSMLDVSVRVGVLALLDRLRREEQMGILMITHDLSSAAHFADRIAVMYLGRIVEEGPVQEVIQNPQHPYTAALLRAVPTLHLARASSATVSEDPTSVSAEAGCRFQPRCPAAQEVCLRIDPELRSTRPSKPSHRVACLLAEGYVSRSRAETGASISTR